MNVTDIQDDVDAAMVAIVSAADTLGVTLPDRHVTSAGGLVYDCEMVAVQFGGLTLGNTQTAEGLLTGASYAPGGLPILSIQLEAVIVRCARERMGGRRGDQPPEPADIALDLADASADIAVLHVAAADMSGFAHGVGDISGLYAAEEAQGGFRAVRANWTHNLAWRIPS